MQKKKVPGRIQHVWWRLVYCSAEKTCSSGLLPRGDSRRTGGKIQFGIQGMGFISFENNIKISFVNWPLWIVFFPQTGVTATIRHLPTRPASIHCTFLSRMEDHVHGCKAESTWTFPRTSALHLRAGVLVEIYFCSKLPKERRASCRGPSLQI